MIAAILNMLWLSFSFVSVARTELPAAGFVRATKGEDRAKPR
jgi:hypothetical protein